MALRAWLEPKCWRHDCGDILKSNVIDSIIVERGKAISSSSALFDIMSTLGYLQMIIGCLESHKSMRTENSAFGAYLLLQWITYGTTNLSIVSNLGSRGWIAPVLYYNNDIIGAVYIFYSLRHFTNSNQRIPYHRYMRSLMVLGECRKLCLWKIIFVRLQLNHQQARTGSKKYRSGREVNLFLADATKDEHNGKFTKATILVRKIIAMFSYGNLLNFSWWLS